MVTGLLGKLGCDTAKTLMPANFANETGYFESSLIASLNDRILAAAGEAWDSWRQIPPEWFSSDKAQGFREEAISLLEQEYEGSSFFALKEPRILQLLPFWKSVFDDCALNVLSLHIYRHPLNVTASLNRRDGISEPYGQLLWLRNVLEAEQKTRELPRYFCEYDAVVSDWKTMAEDMANKLDFTWPVSPEDAAEKVNQFVDPDLKHHAVERPNRETLSDLGELAEDVFNILNTWAVSGDSAQGRDQLDVLRTQMEHIISPVCDLIEAERSSQKNLRKMQDQQKKFEQNLQDMLSQKEQEQHVAKHWKQVTTKLEEDRERINFDRQSSEARQAHLVDSLRKELATVKAVTQEQFAQAKAESDARAEAITARHVMVVRDLRDELVRYHHKVATMEAEGEHKDRVIKEQTDKIDMMQHQIESLISSTSWRLTRPLRVIKRALRG